jgi:phosphonate transport system substrate-binding protein
MTTDVQNSVKTGYPAWRTMRPMIAKLRIATFLSSNMLPVYEFIVDAIGRELGYGAELVVGASFDQFANGEVDAGFICGLPYVQLARQRPAPVELLAAPVIRGDRYAGRPIYFSDVIVHRDSPVRTFADLRGRSWAYNDPDSHSGYNLTRHHLVITGETGGFFGRVVAAGFHQRAIRMVATGEVEAAAIDSQVLTIELRDYPDLREELRVIGALGPSTIQPVVAARHLPADLKAALRATLLRIGDDPAARNELARGFVERFVPVTDADYDDIRSMLAAAEHAGFLTLA